MHRLIVSLVVALGVAACSINVTPKQANLEANPMQDGPGVFSGEDGEFTLNGGD